MISRHSRRNFLAAASALAIAGPNATALPWTPTQQEDASALIAGKDKRLLVLKKFPAVFETPLPLLTENFITPKSLLFIRNNQQPDDAATCAPSVHTDWSVNFTGGINKQLTVSLQQLREMEITEYEMVLQCSGNGRSLFSKAAQTNGTQWGRGGVGNVRFAGVRLSTVFEKNGIEIDPSVRYVTAAGADEALPGKEKFLHSLPLGDVLNRSIIALDLNGEPLSAIHGGPLRLITPGIYATMNMKWLNELNFVGKESTNHNHAVRYRVPNERIQPGDAYDFTLENSKYNWSMKVKSIVLTPNEGDTLRPGMTTIKGVAFNDGMTKITEVFVSINEGQTWQRAQLTPSNSLYGWTQFSLQQNLPAGKHAIWCRAIDAYGRTQPNEGSIVWNPSGYEWNGIEKICVDVA
jgi:sulfite oxidase